MPILAMLGCFGLAAALAGLITCGQPHLGGLDSYSLALAFNPASQPLLAVGLALCWPSGRALCS
jgi:hypothetical protein